MNIKLILKGFIIGVGKIIPGVSGSMLAYSLGIYESIIEAVTNFFDNPKKHFKILFNFVIGVFLAITLFSKLILFLLNNYYNETMYLFLGLIIGTLINFRKELKVNKKNIILFLATLLIFYFLTSSYSFPTFVYRGNILDHLYTGLLGMIDAVTSIVPGISGTAIFMMLGSYEYVLSILGNPFSLQFIIYGIGLLGGIILTCYIMNYFLKNNRHETNSIVFALMIGSIFVLIKNLTLELNINIIILLIIGLIIGYIFDK